MSAEADTAAVSRRAFIASVAALSSSALVFNLSSSPPSASAATVAAAAATASSVLRDDQFFYEVNEPGQGWEKSIASLSGGRPLTSYTFKSDGKEANISVVVTQIPSDFVKLSSFGTIERVENTILPPGRGLEGKMIKAETITIRSEDSTGPAYRFEYELRPNKTAAMKKLWTLFSIKPGQSIVTITGQCDAGSDLESVVEPTFNSMLNSFRILPTL